MTWHHVNLRRSKWIFPDRVLSFFKQYETNASCILRGRVKLDVKSSFLLMPWTCRIPTFNLSPMVTPDSQFIIKYHQIHPNSMPMQDPLDMCQKLQVGTPLCLEIWLPTVCQSSLIWLVLNFDMSMYTTTNVTGTCWSHCPTTECYIIIALWKCKIYFRVYKLFVWFTSPVDRSTLVPKILIFKGVNCNICSFGAKK